MIVRVRVVLKRTVDSHLQSPLNSVSQSMMSRVEVSASLTNVGILAVGAFDLLNCSLSVFGIAAVFNVGQ